MFVAGRNPDKEMRTHSGRKLFIDNKDLDAAMNNLSKGGSGGGLVTNAITFFYFLYKKH